jgi:RNA polymerase sigma-70 factor, ECF subfamily
MNTSGISALRIISRFVNGDSEAFAELVSQHEGWVRAFLRSRVRRREVADDLAQDVFVTAFKSIGEFKGKASFEIWLRGIAVNHLRNYIRKKKEDYIGSLSDLEKIIVYETGPSSIDVDTLDTLVECVDSLDENSRRQLYDRYVKGKTLREISQQTGTGYSALTMKFHRLRELLADCVREKLKDQLS